MKFPTLVLTIMLMLTGCIPWQLRPGVDDEVLQRDAFFRFIDAETAIERKQARQALEQDFPQSPLTARAINLDAERSKQQVQTKKLTGELKRCREKYTQKETDNAALRKDLEKLKQLVIEMETRAR